MGDVNDLINFLWRHNKCPERQLLDDEMFYRIIVSLVADRDMAPVPTGMAAFYHLLLDKVVLAPVQLALHRHSGPELLDLLSTLVSTCHALTAV